MANKSYIFYANRKVCIKSMNRLYRIYRIMCFIVNLNKNKKQIKD